MNYEQAIKKLEAQIEELKAKQELHPVWKPEIEESYYVADVGTVSEYEWCDDSVDEYYSKVGNLFKTEQEAEDYARAMKLIETIRRERFKAQGNWCPSLGVMRYTVLWDQTKNRAWTDATNWAFSSDVFGSWQEFNVLQGIIEKYDSELGWYFVDYLPSIN